MSSEEDSESGKTIDVPCTMCGLIEDDPVNYGDLKQVVWNGKTISAHNFCLLFSHGLKQRDIDDDVGLHGFLPVDIETEKRRGGKLKCHFCQKKGATAACCNPSCKTSYHFTCAVNAGATDRPHFHFCDQFA